MNRGLRPFPIHTVRRFAKVTKYFHAKSGLDVVRTRYTSLPVTGGTK